MNDPGSVYKFINDHHQLRWLADGVNRMALGSIINALWDAWAKVENKPMWKLLVGMPPQKIVDAIDWRYMEDALTKDEAFEILNEKHNDEHHDLEIGNETKRS
jgi:L-fuconate dehydratase